MQRAALAIYGLSSHVVFAPDFAEYECEQDREYDANLQVNGVADFVMLFTNIDVQSVSSSDCCRRGTNRDQQDDQERCRITH